MNRQADPTSERSSVRTLLRLIAATILGGTLVMAGTAAEDDASRPPDARRTAKEALSEFHALIGGWRGVGLPKRGSRSGAWTESAEWVWEFQDGVGIRYDVEKGQLLDTALLTYDAKTGTYRLRGRFADGSERTYTGRLDENKLVLGSAPDDAADVHRLTITQLNDKRTLVLYETRRQTSRFYRRVAEVGYTREGTSLAEEGRDGPECIVTGGKGTIKIRYKGETYWVCCSGCKQAFDDDPEGTIAEYQRTLSERKKK